MQEDCEALDDGQVRCRAVPEPGQWIRLSGEDVTRGATVLHRGDRLGPAALGLAASIGLSHLEVTARPRVALLSTGDELVMPGDVPPEAMPPGAIYNSNRFFLRSLLERLGCVVTDLGIVPDQFEATRQALHQASLNHDLILTSGGVSVGEEDHIKPAVQALGQLHLWSLAIKPGKPFAFGSVRREPDRADSTSAHFIGLPGNPVSSFVTFLLLVRPFLLSLQGARDVQAPRWRLRAATDGPKADRRREFLRARRNAAGELELFPNQSSGVLTSAVWAHGVIDNPAGTVIRAGDTVDFIPWSEWLA
jgi:molybdopterin molybdotransferase